MPPTIYNSENNGNQDLSDKAFARKKNDLAAKKNDLATNRFSSPQVSSTVEFGNSHPAQISPRESLVAPSPNARGIETLVNDALPNAAPSEDFAPKRQSANDVNALATSFNASAFNRNSIRNAATLDFAPAASHAKSSDEVNNEVNNKEEGLFSGSLRRRLAAADAAATNWFAKRGHALTFAGLYLFTVIVYLRPYEFIPALSGVESLAMTVGAITVLIFLPTQLATDGNLFNRTREVNLLFILFGLAFLSIPLALDRSEAWAKASSILPRIAVTFILLVNVMRTEKRVMKLIHLLFAVGVYLSVTSMNDYAKGNFTVGGDRVAGAIGGMFSNPNDFALHLATMIPLAFALAHGSSNNIKRIVYYALTALMMGGVVVTFSRGGFIGMVISCVFYFWIVARRHRVRTMALMIVIGIAFVVFAPGEYGGRLASITNSSLDTGSSNARQALFWRGLFVMLKNPVLGVGISNFHIVSNHEQVVHNAYLEIGAETGIAALIVYVLFVTSPLFGLRQIAKQTNFEITDINSSNDDSSLNPSKQNAVKQERKNQIKRLSKNYYLAVGIQGSIIAYMVSSFFLSVAYIWYVYYLIAIAVCFRGIYEAEYGALPTKAEVKEERKQAKKEALQQKQRGYQDKEPSLA